MKLLREFEDRVHVEFQTGQIAGFTHLYAGQEAIAVGVCEHLTDDDRIISTHRGHGHCLAKGCDVTAMMKELWGSTEGLCGGKGGTMHIADFSRGMLGANAVVGAGPPIALGAALAFKLRGEPHVAVSFTGDGGTNIGTVFEAMNMAVVLKLPKIFVFEDNLYGEFTAANYAVGCASIAERAAAFGMPAWDVDGLDFFAVHEAAGAAVERARSGQGPSVIVAHAVRFYGHHEGDAQSYRAKGEGQSMRATHDCLSRFAQRVLSDGTLAESEMAGIDTEIRAELDTAVQAARAAPRPVAADVLTDVYASYP
jgi:pyruvate dehydrogenase E1 component alpha subunit